MINVKELYEKAYGLYEAKKFDEALDIVEELKRIDPKFKATYLLEILLLDELNHRVKLIAAIEKILPHIKISDPKGRETAADLFDTLGHAQQELAMPEAALKNIKFAAQLTSKNDWTQHRWGAAIFCSNHVENFSVEDSRILYASLKKCFADITPFPQKFYAHKKIRVGFLSADFILHVAMVWSWALLIGLNKNYFETYLYSAGKKSDVITGYLRDNADGWRDISDLTDKQAAQMIRDDEIDILFDLSGYTKNSRIEIAVYRPATVQISGIGYMNSTGLDAMDYFLTDEYCAGNPDYFTEKFLIMPNSHICYVPTTDLAPAAEPPCVKNGYVTFGTFNKFSKITDSILRAWKKILDAVPNSRLLLKNKMLETEDEKNFVRERLKNFGFDLARVELRPFSKDHLPEYADMDIALDTFPYTGGVTTCEALYMGVPVVSLYGDRHGTRFGLSILANVGLGGLVADSYDAYVKIAVELAADKDSLVVMRKELRGMVKNSPLMDAKNYIRDMETAFVKILDAARK